MYQSRAMIEHVRAVRSDADISVISMSKRVIPYPAESASVLGFDCLTDFDCLNSFDAILVGGGGLLSMGHHPLTDDDWVASVRTRLIGVSLGAARIPAEASSAFIKRCDAFSVRDEYSKKAVADIRGDTRLTLDPIFLSHDMFHAEGYRQVRRPSMCLIPSKITPQTEAFYKYLNSDILNEKDIIVSMNMGTDRSNGLDDIFQTRPRFVRTQEELLKCIEKRAFLISERYHGCIYALRMGVPTLGLTLRSAATISKITELFNTLEMSEALLTTDTPRPRRRLRLMAQETFKAEKISAIVTQERETLRAYLREVLS